MDIENKGEKLKKNNISHRIFKIIVLFIVAIFCYLIISFIKIQFMTYNKKGFNLESNFEKYKYLDSRDQHFNYLKNNKIKGELESCNIKDFYYEHVTNYKPCFISKNTNSELEEYFNKIQDVLADNINLNFNEKSFDKSDSYSTSKTFIEKNLKGLFNKIGVMNFAKILNFSQLFIKTAVEKKEVSEKFDLKSSPKKSNAVLNNKDYLFIQLEGDAQFLLSPITQINKVRSYRDEEETQTISKFNEIKSEKDLFEEYAKTEDESNLILLFVNLKRGDMLYVPAYFFIQDNFPKESADILMKFEFESNSRILNTIFKVLFDDNMDLNIEQSSYMS